MTTKQIIIALGALLLIGGGAYWLMNASNTTDAINENDMLPVEPNGGIGDGAQPLDEVLADENANLPYTSEIVIGSSVKGTPITAYHFGNGTKEVLLIGGVHGSDAANTAELAQAFVQYFKTNESLIAEDMRVTIIPVVNPDGLAAGGTVGRFNSNNVDLNRNFGCDWAATSKWRDQDVSGGTAPYSEPEAMAIRNYIEDVNVVGAVVWFAAEGKVYPSACEGNPSQASVALAGTFGTAAGYGVENEFNAYKINGDMTNWLADEGIPAISVLLTDRQDIEWTKNEAGIKAVLTSLSN